MQTEHEEGVTIGEVCRMIGRHLWKVLLASVALAAVLALLVAFVVNPFKQEYSMGFYLTYPGSETMKYPDGSSFSYRDIISEEALSAVQASDERFGSVDVGKMVREDGISVTAEFVAVNENYVQTGNYTVTVQSKYFSSRDTAQAFIRSLAEAAMENVVERAASIAYVIDESVFTDVSYEDKIALMQEQRENIFDAYDEWIDEYRAGYMVGEKSLSAYRAEAAVACGQGALDDLRRELELNAYVPLEEREERIFELQRETVLNEEKIAALKEIGSSSSEGAASEMIAELVVRNVQIENEISNLTEENITAFDAKLHEQYAALQTAANNLKSVTVQLYRQETSVHFTTNRAVVSGDIGIAVVAVAGFIIGFLIAGAVACGVEYKRSLRAQKAASSESDGDGEAS